MKRFLSFLAAAGLMLGFVACKENKEGDGPVTPEFPKVTEQALASSGADAGFEYTATLNVPWTLTLTDNAEGHFLMTENGQNVDSVNGTANASKKVVVYATSEPAPGEAFECTLTMTATGTTESAVVARIKHSAAPEAGYSFELHVGYLDEMGSWEYAPEGGYAYTEEAVAEGGTIELLAPAGMGKYMLPVQVIADKGWALSGVPEWLNNTTIVTNEETGAQTFRLEAENYEIEDPTGELTFSYGDGTKFTYTVTIPNYGEFFDMDAGDERLYDAEGNLTKQTNVNPFISLVGEPKVVTFTKVVQTGSSYYVEGADWFNVEVELFDSEEGANNYICDWRPIVTVEANPTTETREGLVMILPWYALEALEAEGATEETLADYLVGNEVNPNYTEYVYAYIEQEGQPIPEVPAAISPADPDAVNNSNAYVFFKQLTADPRVWPYTEFPGIDQFYQLVYIHEWSYDDGQLNVSEEFAGDLTFEYYNADARAYDETDEPLWLNIGWLNNTQSAFKVDMLPENDKAGGVDYAHEGFVVVSHEGTPFACIYCIFDENYEYEAGNDQPGVGGNGELVSFVAETDGDDKTYVGSAELAKVGEHNAENLGIGIDIYNEFNAQGIVMYCLDYYEEDPENVTLNVPAGLQVSYMPTNNSWLSSEIEQYQFTNSTMTIKMTQPGEDDKTMHASNPDIMLGCIQLSDKGNNVVFIYCRPMFAAL